MPAGQLRHRVTLDDPVVDTTPVTFSPSKVWASIRPSAPGAYDESRITHLVTVRYHPQITFNTRITHRDRSLYVRGIENVDERNEMLRLLCEEVQTP